MSDIINILIAAASLIIAILDFIKNNYKGDAKYIHNTKVIVKQTTIIGVPNNNVISTSAYIPAKYTRHFSSFLFVFTVLCIFGMLYFSVKPIAPTIALVHILIVVIFTHFCIFDSSASVGIPIKHYLLYVASIIALVAILIYFSVSGDVLPFFSYKVNKTYLYFVMIVPLIVFAYQSNWLIGASKGILSDDERFVIPTEVLIILSLILTGAFEKVVAIMGTAIFALFDRFFNL